MTAITLTVELNGACVVLPETGEEYLGTELDVAMQTVSGLADRAMG
jgi:hypothetical protein